jgi:hypothetical protein
LTREQSRRAAREHHLVRGGQKRALVVRFREQDGSEAAFAFGQQLGMPNLAAWVQALQPRSM